MVIEFADRETALACYNSPEYEAAKAHRVSYQSDVIVVKTARSRKGGVSFRIFVFSRGKRQDR